ncbi:unnamed protein product [Paramecium octaurelia]|uniref:Uncharacterized protein n=1 Tax=Paramecium octaurelia TaxID=43137 RepID=A0A8S1TE52_PAROT|nr:unnamed protein product [Paramecium octaurelia]
MEKKIIEFLTECQTNIGNYQDLIQMEEIVHQLISIVYFLIEQGQQSFEEEKNKYQALNQEFSNLQAQYTQALLEIETLKTHHNQDIEEFSIIEDRMIQKEYYLEKEKDEQLNTMKSSTTEMMRSLKIQQQQLEYFKRQNEDQQMEIKELRKLLIQQKQQKQPNTEPALDQLESQNQTTTNIKEQKGNIPSCETVKINEQDSSLSIELNQQSNVQENQQKENTSLSILRVNSIKETNHHVKYARCHSKNQSINWVKLATIAQTESSISSKLDNQELLNKQHQRKLSKYMSTDCEPLFLSNRNPYKDFYTLISQSVKLNLNQTKYYVINVDSLYNELLAEGVPFHKWYKRIEDYILKKVE